LKFEPLPAPNSIPVLTNVLNNLPKLNTIQILNSENGLAKVEYDFEQLGISESHIHFDVHGKIKQIEFVENLVQQQIDQLHLNELCCSKFRNHHFFDCK